MGINITLYQRWPLSLTGFGDFRSLATNPRVTIVCSSNVSFPWPETVGYNVVFIWGRNNVTKIQINIGMVPLLYSTDFQVLGPGAVFNVLYTLYSYCTTLSYNTCVLQYCVILHYYFQFFTYFPANFSKITPHFV